MIKPAKGMPELLRPNPPPRTSKVNATSGLDYAHIKEAPKLQAARLPLPTTQVENKTIGRFINTYA